MSVGDNNMHKGPHHPRNQRASGGAIKGYFLDVSNCDSSVSCPHSMYA